MLKDAGPIKIRTGRGDGSGTQLPFRGQLLPGTTPPHALFKKCPPFPVPLLKILQTERETGGGGGAVDPYSREHQYSLLRHPVFAHPASHSLIHLFIRPPTHPSMHAFIHASTHPCIPLCRHAPMHSSTPSRIYTFFHSFAVSLACSFTHLLTPMPT